jgi:hypothetical protein
LSIPPLLEVFIAFKQSAFKIADKLHSSAIRRETAIFAQKRRLKA